LNMTSPDLSVGLQSLLQSKETSRDDIFSQVSSPRKSKKKAKRSKIKRKKLFSFFGGTKTNQTPVDFQLSSPSNFRQAGHIDFDEDTGEFNGLPKEWEVMLGTSGMSKEDYADNPDTLFKF